MRCLKWHADNVLGVLSPLKLKSAMFDAQTAIVVAQPSNSLGTELPMKFMWVNADFVRQMKPVRLLAFGSSKTQFGYDRTQIGNADQVLIAEHRVGISDAEGATPSIGSKFMRL